MNFPTAQPQNEQNGESSSLSSPKFSVIVPAWGVADFIAETLRSIFAQTFTDYEVILVNDGSPDTEQFEKEIAPFLDKIIYLKQANGGAAKARNTAIKAARGAFLAFLDGDDVWLPQYLAEQLSFLERSNFEMIYADALFFGGDTHDGKTYMQVSRSRGAVTSESLLAWTCNVITSGTVVKREKLINAGLFDETDAWARAEDYEMWFRLAKTGVKIGYQRKVLLKYRVREGSLSGNFYEQAERNLKSLAGLNQKFDLTPRETKIWERQMRFAQSVWDVERGKAALDAGDFATARNFFKRSAPFYGRCKKLFVNLALRFAPAKMQEIIGSRNYKTK